VKNRVSARGLKAIECPGRGTNIPEGLRGLKAIDLLIFGLNI
jgi:hypothetical protein